MMRNVWHRLGPRGGISRLVLVAGLALAAPEFEAGEGADKVTVSSVETYVARDLKSGEANGYFVHVLGNVRISPEAASWVDVARGIPQVLAARLVVDGVQLV